MKRAIKLVLCTAAIALLLSGLALAQPAAADPKVPAEPASTGAAGAAGEPAPANRESPPMRGQRRPWRS